MMSTSEYRQRLKQRRAEARAAAKRAVAPETSFRDWIVTQVIRLDAVGALARDIVSEEKRIGKPLTQLNNRVDLLWYCAYAPREVGLSREIGLAAWLEWLVEIEREKEGPILNYDI